MSILRNAIRANLASKCATRKVSIPDQEFFKITASISRQLKPVFDVIVIQHIEQWMEENGIPIPPKDNN